MSMAQKHEWQSESEYLASEELEPRKREYVAGEAYAMAGASARHNRISLNVATRLDAATRGVPCEVFMADMKVKVEAYQAFYYPDVMLGCPKDDDHPLYRTGPCLLVEVLSPSTASIDEREKWLHYRAIPSLRYYLLIDSEKRHARIRIRDGEGWLEQTLDEEDIVPLTCGPVSASLCLDDIYERTGLL
jgi:Uma2 family endonuclease